MTTNRRRRAWADSFLNTTISSGADSTPKDLLSDLPPMTTKTVARLIGRLLIVPDDRDASVDTVQSIAMGIGVAAEEAFTAGIVPDPDSTSEYPPRGWLWVTTAVMAHNNSSGTLQGFHYPEIIFDVGSNRIVDKGICYLAMSNNIADGTPVIVRVIGRIRAICLT